jgi:uncharacterized membrane protein required for colicin V production
MALELIGLLAGVSVAAIFYRQLTALIEPLFFGLHNLAAIFSYLVIYVAIYELFAYAIKWLDETQWKNNPLPFIEKIRTTFGGLIERGGGLVAGLIKGNIVIGTVIILLTLFPLFGGLKNLMYSSRFVSYVVKIASTILPNLPAELRGG